MSVFLLAILLFDLISCLDHAPNKVNIPESKDCKNIELKSQGFYVQSSTSRALDVTAGESSYIRNEIVRFIATMKPMVPPNLGELNAYPGECQDVQTDMVYRRCGVATALLTKCLQDDIVTRNGGILQTGEELREGQPSNLVNFETFDNPGIKYGIWQDKIFADKVRELCHTLIAMPCRPIIGETEACNVYFDAAISAGYDNIFTDKHNYDGRSIRRSIMRTTDAKTSFNDNTVDFLTQRGGYWFFCKCLPGKKKDCKYLEVQDGFDVID